MIIGVVIWGGVQSQKMLSFECAVDIERLKKHWSKASNRNCTTLSLSRTFHFQLKDHICVITQDMKDLETLPFEVAVDMGF